LACLQIEARHKTNFCWNSEEEEKLSNAAIKMLSIVSAIQNIHLLWIRQKPKFLNQFQSKYTSFIKVFQMKSSDMPHPNCILWKVCLKKDEHTFQQNVGIKILLFNVACMNLNNFPKNWIKLNRFDFFHQFRWQTDLHCKQRPNWQNAKCEIWEVQFIIMLKQFD
jgi:hypothetical protein